MAWSTKSPEIIQPQSPPSVHAFLDMVGLPSLSLSCLGTALLLVLCRLIFLIIPQNSALSSHWRIPDREKMTCAGKSTCFFCIIPHLFPGAHFNTTFMGVIFKQMTFFALCMSFSGNACTPIHHEINKRKKEVSPLRFLLSFSPLYIPLILSSS